MAQEMFLEYMNHVLNEGICFKPNTFKFIVLKKSIPIDNMIDSPKNYVEPADQQAGKIDDNELKVFVDFLEMVKKESYTRVKSYQDNEIIPLM